MEILATIKHEVMTKVNIDLPFYCKSKSGSFLYKIESEDKAIQVYTHEILNPSISKVMPNTAFSTEYDEISETEFETILQKTLNQIIN